MGFDGLKNGFSQAMINGLPMAGFLLVYISSNIFGAIVLFYKLEPFYSVFIYHSGIWLPVALSAEQMVTFWLVAIGAPLIMIGAFWAAFSPVSRNLHHSHQPIRSYDPPFWIVILVFGALVYFGARSLGDAGAFDLLGTWGNYTDLVEARWGLFATLSFFEFANFYQFIPVVAILALLLGLERRGGARILGIACALVAILIGVLIFQKKAVIITMLMMALALVVRSYLVDSTRVARLVGLAGASLLALALVFFTASVVPTLTSQKSVIGSASKTAQNVDFVKQWQERSAELTASGRSLTDGGAKAEFQAIAAQAREQAAKSEFKNNPLIVSIVNFTMRTSVTAVYYIAVFPDLHPYYPLDLGQDIIGMGEMPDDNLVVWNEMYPDMPGVVAAPFNFVLFSQGGIWITMAMSIIIGLLLGLIWALILQSSSSMAVQATIAAVIVVGTMHLALDAMRNSLIVSYGFAWGLLPLLILLLLGRIAGRGGKSLVEEAT